MKNAFLGLMVITCLGACGDDPLFLSGRGESCEARTDCVEGLRCINRLCTQSDFPVAPTAKSCDRIECAVDEDCCPPQSAFCDDLQQRCAGGDAFSCDDYDRSCRCRQACQDERCVAQCTDSNDCAFGLTCAQSRCVQCVANQDCPAGSACSDGQCATGCAATNDCPYFHQCQDGTCVETGCMTDRECIASLGDPRARCQATTCTVPCESDAECNTQGRYSFFSCNNGQCEYVGCETDEECRIFLSVPVGGNQRAVCRE